MTVSELEERLGNAELIEWMALDALRSHEAETAARQAKKGMRQRRR